MTGASIRGRDDGLAVRAALVLLRVTVAGIFIAHAATRVLNGSVPQFARFLEARGLARGTEVVWSITAFELLGGALLAAGRLTRLIAAGFFAMLAVGIVLIHARLGWWVGEHGTGGMEYSVVLMVCLVVVAAAARRPAPAAP